MTDAWHDTRDRIFKKNKQKQFLARARSLSFVADAASFGDLKRIV